MLSVFLKFMLHHNAILDDQAALRGWFERPNRQNLDVLFRNPTVDFSIQLC